MRPSKAHGFVAWLFDAYIASFLFGAIVAAWIALQRSTGNAWLAVAILAVSIFVPTVYHMVLARRISWCSPGERIAGRFLSDGSKVWLNPYCRTRWPLFAAMLFVTLLAGNTWDAIGRGDELQIAKVALDILALSILSVGMVAVGQGRRWGVFAPPAYAMLLSVSALHASQTAAPLAADALVKVSVYMGVTALLSLLVGVMYIRFRMPEPVPDQ